MKVTIQFKHFEHTEAIDAKIQKKSSKLKKYFSGNTELIWTCSVKEEGKQVARLQVKGPHFDFSAEAADKSLYHSLDLVVSKIEKQVSKRKDKLRNHTTRKHKIALKNKVLEEIEQDEEQVIQDFYDEDVA